MGKNEDDAREEAGGKAQEGRTRETIRDRKESRSGRSKDQEDQNRT